MIHQLYLTSSQHFNFVTELQYLQMYVNLKKIKPLHFVNVLKNMCLLVVQDKYIINSDNLLALLLNWNFTQSPVWLVKYQTLNKIIIDFVIHLKPGEGRFWAEPNVELFYVDITEDQYQTSLVIPIILLNHI